jgi:hypothetical protein
MNTVRNLLSHIRLPSFSMSPPCDIITEFFYLCGHTVTSRRCRNNARLWRANGYHDPSVACDAHCPTRSLPTLIHMYLSCSWCRQFPRVPYTKAVRSDPGVDRLDPGEVRRRRDFYLSVWRARLTESAREAFFRNIGRRALWETHRRLEHEWQDRQGLNWQERTFYMGEGNDDRLMIPLDRSTIPEGAEGQCRICFQSLREDTPPVVLPCHAAHRLHVGCVNMWMSQGPAHRHCPFCRAPFRIVTYQEWNTQSEDFIRFFVDYQLPPAVDGELEIEEEE